MCAFCFSELVLQISRQGDIREVVAVAEEVAAVVAPRIVMSNQVAEESTVEQPADVYRHYMEVQFSGTYLDILEYIKTLEAAEWRFLWDHIEITATSYPALSVTLRLSTLSMNKSWVGV